MLKDDQEAARFYKLAADKGDVYGQVNLANFHERGRGGLEINDREAARLYSLAAAQGNARAQARLGLFFENGRGGLNKDDREAARFYKLAATANRQRPFVYGSLPGEDEYYFRLR